MRNRLAVLAVAVTSFVVLAYTIPLALLVARRAEEGAKIDAEREVQAVAAQLIEAVSIAQSGELSALEGLLRVPSGVLISNEEGARVGDEGAIAAVAGEAVMQQEAVWADRDDGGWELALPVVTLDGALVVQTVVPPDALRDGVGEAWTFLAILGLAAILAALLLADRLGRSLREPVETLASAAERLGAGRLETRVEGLEIEELDVVGEALNRLAPQLESLMVEERESLADLSHRLRTPLAALRLQSEAIGDEEDRIATARLVDRMELAVDELIENMRRGEPSGACDASEVVADRCGFWKVLAEEQGRDFQRSVSPGPLMVMLSASQLESLVDILLGNVFDHTGPGTPLSISLRSAGAEARLDIEDAGPGLPGDIDPFERGESGAGSTGLGLDIARRLTEEANGDLTVTPSAMGGVSVRVALPLAT